jgi:hypothetical protein
MIDRFVKSSDAAIKLHALRAEYRASLRHVFIRAPCPAGLLQSGAYINGFIDLGR